MSLGPPSSLEAQESVMSEDWASDEEVDDEDYDNYYGEEDTDVHLASGEENTASTYIKYNASIMLVCLFRW